MTFSSTFLNTVRPFTKLNDPVYGNVEKLSMEFFYWISTNIFSIFDNLLLLSFFLFFNYYFCLQKVSITKITSIFTS